MSYLQLPAGVPAFSKAVISLWFRVPQATIDAVHAFTPPFHDGPLNLADMRVVPLLTLGAEQVQTQYSAPETNVAVYMTPNAHVYGPIYDFPKATAGASFPVVPSFIGLVCFPDSPVTLTINLQAKEFATLTGYLYNSQMVQVWNQYDLTENPPGYSSALGSCWTTPGDFFLFTTLVDNSFALVNQPGFFQIQTTIEVRPDQWHHLLVSFDISNGCSTFGTTGDFISGVARYSKLWCALDDINYTGQDLGGLDIGDPNMILTDQGGNAIGGEAGYQSNCPTESAKYDLASGTIPAGGFGVPASGKYVSSIRRVEMAELQIFTGVSLDTGVEKNRRLFITARDKDGKQYPVNQSPITIPLSKSAVGDPATWEPGADTPAFVPPELDPSSVPTSIKDLGGTAAVDFTKCSLNWIMGRNLGTAKGKVETAGKIKAYLPDPVLE